MPFVYDNLIASVVGATVLLILMSIQMRTTRTSVAQSARHTALNRAETFATWLENDLEEMGRNMSDGSDVFKVPARISTDCDETDEPTPCSPTGFTLSPDNNPAFYYKKKVDGSTEKIEYGVEEDDPVSVGERNRIVYNLKRSGGGSAGRLGYFDLQFINENAEEISKPKSKWKNNPDEIRGVRVHFSVVVPYQNEETSLQEVHRMVVVPFNPSLQ